MIPDELAEFMNPPRLLLEDHQIGSVLLIHVLELSGDVAGLMRFRNNLKGKHGTRTGDIENIYALATRAINSEVI